MRALDWSRPEPLALLLLVLVVADGCASTEAETQAREQNFELELRLRVSTPVRPFNNENKFVLYKSGLLIRQASSDGVATYFASQLSVDEVAKLLLEVDAGALEKLGDEYYVGRGTDQVVYEISVFDTSKRSLHSTIVYGFREDGRRPEAFAQAFRVITGYRPAKEHAWFPPYVYVRVSRGNESSGGNVTSCGWPEGWSDLSSPGSQREQNATGGVGARLGTIRLNGNLLTEVQVLLDRCSHEIWLGDVPIKARLIVNLPHEQTVR